MSGWIYLEIGIGLVLVYLIVSLLCTNLTELIARWLSLRARTLKDGILKLLNYDEKLNDEILNHPLFQGLSPKDPKKPRTLENLKHPEKEHLWDLKKIGKWYVFKKTNYGPSELPPATFAQIIFDTIMKAGDGYTSLASPDKIDSTDIDEKGRSKSLMVTSGKVIQNLEKKIDSLNIDNNTKQVLKSLLTSAKTKVTSWDAAVKEFRTSLEKWFDDSMQRVTGWYRRKTQLIVLVLALGICFSFNIDSFGIASALYNNPALRETVVAAAEAQVTSNLTAESVNMTYSDTQKKLDALNLPIGWNTEKGTANSNPDTGWGWLLKIAGILVTAFAASLGSGFWFDLLKKLVNIRAAGKTPTKTEETTSDSK